MSLQDIIFTSRKSIYKFLIIMLLFSFILDLTIYSYVFLTKSNYKVIAKVFLDKPIVQCGPFDTTNCFDIEKAKDIVDQIKSKGYFSGILLVLSCPGGEFYEVYDVIKEFQSLNMPIFAYVKDYAFSGCYWIASRSKLILADKYAMVGSIGVKSGIISIEGLLKKLGIKYYPIYYGKYKNAGDYMSNVSKEELNYLRNITYRFYQIFLNDVIRHRNITDKNKIREIASSKIFFADDAKKLKLIDYIVANESQVKKIIAKYYNVSEDDIIFEVIKPKEQTNWLYGMVYNFLNILLSGFNQVFKIFT